MEFRIADTFTEGQLSLMRAVAEGLTNSEIARRRGVSERAVEQRFIQRLIELLPIVRINAFDK